MSAVVLANTKAGEETQVLERINRANGAEEAQMFWCIYDAVVKVHSIERLKENIRSGLRQLAGVSNILILMIIEGGRTPQSTEG